MGEKLDALSPEHEKNMNAGTVEVAEKKEKEEFVNPFLNGIPGGEKSEDYYQSIISRVSKIQKRMIERNREFQEKEKVSTQLK